MDLERKYIPATGNPNAKLMVLGEAPGYEEIIAGKPFVGPSGRELDRLLQETGIDRNELWISNVSKYPVQANAKRKKIPFAKRAEMSGVDLNEQISDLQNEINSIKPNCILALGGTALWSLFGKDKIRDYRGSILSGMGCKFVPTYHPAHLLYGEGEVKGYWNREVMKLDFKRAYIQSQFPDIRRPNRLLSICRSSSQLLDFIKRNKGRTRPAVDIEARGACIPFCIGFSFTPNEGITVPLWNKGEIESLFSITDSEMVQLWILMNSILSQPEGIVGQNFKYDHDKIRRIGFNISRLASDTMLKARSINPEWPGALAFNQSILTEEPFYKDEGMYHGKLEDLLIGCSRDACVTKEIDLAMDSDIDILGQRDWYENFILPLHDMYLDIENEGFCIDKTQREVLIDKYIRWSEDLSHELFEITGDYINVNSNTKQIPMLLYEVWKLPNNGMGVGEEEITRLLNLQSLKLTDEKRRGLELILEKRRVEKTISTYLMAQPDYDGKMKTTYYLFLETGRTSTGQLDEPIRPEFEVISEHQLTGKKKKNTKSIGCAFQTMTKHGDIGQDIRSQYIPEPGHIFLQADSAQAEARVVFLLAEDYDALKDIDEHDYHALTTSWFFGGREEDYSKKHLGYESPQRFVGKTLRHAGHLGAGKRRAATTVNTDARKFKIPIAITEGVADKALKIFHAKQPKIRQVFHKGIEEALARLNRSLTSGVPYGINSKVGGHRQFFERWGDELFRMAFSYIPQRSISDNTKAAGLRLRKREPKLTRIIVESHDSLLFTIPERELDYYSPIVKEELERPIRFDTCSLSRPDLKIPCELETGYNYQDLKKFKFHAPIEIREKQEREEIEVRELTALERMLRD